MGNVHGKKKEGNAKSQITVNSYDNYNAPVDNKNIAYLEIPDVGNLKCFQITPGIWVTPEGPKTPNDIKEYNRYLKNVSLYFRRLNLFDIARSFFNVISQACPYKFYKEFYNEKEHGTVPGYIPKVKSTKKKFKNEVATVFIIDKKEKGRKKIGIANLSILITSGELGEESSLPLDNNSTIRDTYGSIALVFFNPLEIHERFIGEDDTFFEDPMITLFHEMIHAFHFLYDYSYQGEEILVRKHKYDLEEIITHGGDRDLSLLKDHIDNHNKTYLTKVQDSIVNNLNKSKKSEDFKKYYAKKYMLEKRDGKYSLIYNDKKESNLIILLQKTFTESKLVKVSNSLGYDSYYDSSGSATFSFEPYNNKLYDLHKGLDQQAIKEYQKTGNLKLIKVGGLIPHKHRE